MDPEALEMPIFELPAVLLPGERMPLHIFEDRYKRMIAHCLDSGELFGIVLHDEEHGARHLGCTARVDEVLERFDDGRLNIVISGETRFRVLDRHEAPDYPAGEVELIDTAGEDTEADPVAAAGARDAFADLVELATGERPDADELAVANAYSIAARVELPPETKQELLELRSESERFQLLDRALRALLEAVERSQRIAERASGNGRLQLKSD